MKIGIAVTTTSKRPEHEAYWRKINEKYNLNAVFIKDVQGVAKAKNECLRALSCCDYVFLFDDDCFPLTPDFADYFISESQRTGFHHFSYLHNTPTIRQVSLEQDVPYYNNSSGCMMFLTRKAIDTVGAFDEGFGLYGYEHADYSFRVKAKGLIPHANMCPTFAARHIYSMDMDNHMALPIQHHSTLNAQVMSDAVKVAGKYHNDNKDRSTYIAL